MNGEARIWWKSNKRKKTPAVISTLPANISPAKVTTSTHRFCRRTGKLLGKPSKRPIPMQLDSFRFHGEEGWQRPESTKQPEHPTA